MKIAIGLLSCLGIWSTQVLAFELSSHDIKPNSTISKEFAYKDMNCGGQNHSPELTWKEAPAETKSFALTFYDPDADTGSGFWHWIVYNIPKTVNSVPKDWKVASVGALEVTSDFGISNYGGPCPGPGKVHGYVFTVHALNTEKLAVPANATNAIVRAYIERSTIAKASFKANYSR